MPETTQPNNSKNPPWFILLNLLFLVPVLVWPFVFFSTIFFFDNPDSFIVTLMFFLFVNAYPVYLFGLMVFNAKLYKKHKVPAILFPILVVVVFLGAAVNILGGIENVRSIWTTVQNAPKIAEDENELCCGFTKDSANILYNDTPLANVDMASFDIINYNWAKDKNRVYYNGVAIPYVDGSSFVYLDYQYAKDKNNVYYYEKIIEGADAATFIHLDGTQDGKDKNFCYRYGEKVDCKVLSTEE